MKKDKRYHIVKYEHSYYYFVLGAATLKEFEKSQDYSGLSKAKLIKTFDNHNEAVAFKDAMNLL